MRKSLTTLLLIFVGSYLFAGMDERLDSLQKEMEEVSMQTRDGGYGALFQSASPEIEDTFWFGTLDILYWHPKIGRTEYAATKNGPVAMYPEKGRIKDHDFKWDWGFRAGVGMNVPHDHWDLYLNFTYFENDDTDSSHKTPPATVYAVDGFFGGNFERAKSHYEVLYLNFDLEVGRNYFVSSRLAFRPHIGVKAMRMHLQERVQYSFSSFEQGGSLIGEFYRVRSRSDSDAIGPRIGVQGTWFLCYGFRLFSEFAAALLYEDDEVRQKERASPGSSIHNIDIGLKGNEHHFTPFFQMYSGLSYGRYINNKKVYLLFKLGYEVQYYFNQNQMLEPNNFTFGSNSPPSTRLEYERNGEDVSFYGLTFSTRLDF